MNNFIYGACVAIVVFGAIMAIIPDDDPLSFIVPARQRQPRVPAAQLASGGNAPAATEQRMAHILAGEAPYGQLGAYKLTACILYNDYRKGVKLGRPRWNGWNDSYTSQHLAHVQWARDPQNCKQFAHCIYVGNQADYNKWVAGGYATQGTKFCNKNGCSICAW